MASKWEPKIQNTPYNAQHYAQLDDYTLGLAGALPDPDVVLNKSGKGVGALRAMLVDAHLSSVWDVRKSSVTKFGYGVAGGDSRAVELCQSHINRWNVYAIAAQAVGCRAYGMIPFELLWEVEAGQWIITDVIAKPTEWFAWDIQGNVWKIRKGWTRYDTIPMLRFRFVVNGGSYLNPYGEKVFSRVFWPVTLKRNGLKWWARWLEKFGSPYLIGKHPPNATAGEKVQLLDGLEAMIGSSVGVISADDTMEAVDPAGRAGSTKAHKDFVELMNAEMSKAVLGQTLTTELAGSGGSRAAAQVHDRVRDDIATADRHMVQVFFNELFGLLVRVNLGEQVAVPQFRYEVPDDLEVQRLARDEKVFTMMGTRASRAYAERYGLTDAMIGEDMGGVGATQALTAEQGIVSLADDADVDIEPSPTTEATKQDDKQYERGVFGMLRRFFKGREKQYNGAVDELVEAHKDAIAGAATYDDALAVVMEQVSARAPDADIGDIAEAVAELRWVGMNVGGHYA